MAYGPPAQNKGMSQRSKDKLFSLVLWLGLLGLGVGLWLAWPSLMRAWYETEVEINAEARDPLHADITCPKCGTVMKNVNVTYAFMNCQKCGIRLILRKGRR